jgi:two-component system chemotaxis response regulator CheB
MQNKISNIVAIGASAGGISAVSRLCASFNEDLNAAVFVVIHLSRNSMVEVVLRQIQKTSKLPCRIPQNEEVIQNGYIYLAPPDHHMMLEKGQILVQKGAYENHWRPSIDVLFRTAAAAYDSCVTGIILTGMLDDGSSGMSAIKRSGGRCMIQDPAEAEFADMPNNVLKSVAVDYKGSLEEIGYVLADLFSRNSCEQGSAPDDVKLEAEITLRMASKVEDVEKLGSLTHFTCPDCGGSLIQISGEDPPRYRCYTGHSFTAGVLANEQAKALEESLWIAIRMMEERKNLLLSMEGANLEGQAARAAQIKIHIERLKGILQELGNHNK